MGWMNLKAAGFIKSFRDYPPSQIPASFTIEQVQKNIDATIDALKRKVTTD
jgi:arylsulfatase